MRKKGPPSNFQSKSNIHILTEEDEQEGSDNGSYRSSYSNYNLCMGGGENQIEEEEEEMEYSSDEGNGTNAHIMSTIQSQCDAYGDKLELL